MAETSPNFNLAAKALRRASRLLLRDFLEVRLLRSSVKGSEQFAAKAVERAESSIVEELRSSRPHYGFRCQRIGSERGSDPTREWFISAADGFANYAHGLPHWVMTAALVHKGQPVLSIVFNPLENEMFTAETGKGSWLNSMRIRTTRTSRLSAFLAGTDAVGGDGRPASHYERIRSVAATVAELRAFGSVSLDLANVSCGRLDGFWTETGAPSAFPAGLMLLSEAGGLVAPLEEGSSGGHGLVAAGSDGFSAFASLARARQHSG